MKVCMWNESVREWMAELERLWVFKRLLKRAGRCHVVKSTVKKNSFVLICNKTRLQYTIKGT